LNPIYLQQQQHIFYNSNWGKVSTTTKLYFFSVFSILINLHSKPVHGRANAVVVGKGLNGTNSGYSGASVINVFIAGISDIRRGHGVDTGLEFVKGQATAVA
jgi:hypothetical protein